MKEIRLQEQVKLLADRLACLACLLFDCKELATHDGKVREEVWHALVVAAIGDEEPVFEEVRKHPDYQAALMRVRSMLEARMRELREVA